MSRSPCPPPAIALTSPPAQKWPPAPVSTTARTAGSSRTSATAAPNASRIDRSSALRASGRFMVSTAVAPMRSIWITSMACLLVAHLHQPVGHHRGALGALGLHLDGPEAAHLARL